MKKYFTYHWDDGFELWDTEEEAKKYAQGLIDRDLEWADDGVREDFERIHWGIVKQSAVIAPTGTMVYVEGEGEMVPAVNVTLKDVE